MQIGVTKVVYGDKYLAPAQDMPLWGLTLARLSRGDLTLEQRMGLAPLLLFHVLVLVCLGQEGYSVIQWILGVHRLLKAPGKITERSSKPTVVALNMLTGGHTVLGKF